MHGLGIDAGGTYTDSVVVDMESGEILGYSKSPTTHDDLSAGIRSSLSGLGPELLRDIALTSVSSTLATNSVVEGKGCRVGLLCIGKDFSGPRPDVYARVEGSFRMNGDEDVPFDREAASEAFESMRGHVDAVAVAGYLSVRNPSHEAAAAELAESILGVPCACAHDMTSKLGFEERASTAVMNAGLIPVVKSLLVSVRRIIDEFGIRSPLMVVKGDGSLMSESEAVRRPVETVLSGPASSFMGAIRLTGIEDALIADIGGTTTDAGIVRGGFPAIDPEGALVSGRRTRIMAADISTFGIGGDSRILVNGRRTIVSPTRAIPICFAASEWPSVREEIMMLAGRTDDRAAEDYDIGKITQETEFFVPSENRDAPDMTLEETAFLDLLQERPRRISDAMRELGLPLRAVDVAKLESRGAVMRIGVTPTDILHAEGSFTEFDVEASAVAVAFLARKARKSMREFVADTKAEIFRAIASDLMRKVMSDDSGDDTASVSDEAVIERCLNPRKDYSLEYRLGLPIIGIGAPARAWLPGVASLLHTELVVPELAEIGNAVGTITGCVRETAEVTVRAVGDGFVEDPECMVFADGGRSYFGDPDAAMEFARSESARLAFEKARSSRCPEPVVETECDVEYCEISEDRKFFRRATVRSTASGKPDLNDRHRTNHPNIS